MSTPSGRANFNDSLPAAPTGRVNAKFQLDNSVDPGNVSFNVHPIGSVDGRTTTTETIALSASGKLVTLSNAGAIAVSLDSTVPADFLCWFSVIGAGAATLTPTAGATINGGANLPAPAGTNGLLFWTGSTWWALLAPSTAGLATQAGVQAESYTYAADSGSVNAFAVTLAPVPGSYTAGMEVVFKAANANTASATLNVNGLGAKTIKKLDGATNLVSGDIAAGQIVSVVYDGTNFQLQSGVANAPSSAVTSVFGRTGAVTAQSGDYTAAQVTGAASQTGVQNESYTYAADSGSVNAFAVTLSPVPSGYAAGMEVVFKAANANTASATLNVNGLGAKTIKKLDGATNLASGDIASGQVVSVVYDGTNFQLQSGTAVAGSAPYSNGVLGIVIDGGGAIPVTGSKGFLQAPYDCTVVSWTMVGNLSGSAQITVKKATYSGFPGTSSIVASAPPLISGAQKNTSSSLTGWTTSISKGDVLEFNLDSVTTITRLTLELQVTRSD